MLCLKSYAFNCQLEIIYGQLFSCQCWKYTFAVVLIAILNNFFLSSLYLDVFTE